MKINAELTNREKQVLNSIGEGKSRNNIADILNIEKSTVNKHIEAVFKKLGTQEKVGATILGIYYKHLDFNNLVKVHLAKKQDNDKLI